MGVAASMASAFFRSIGAQRLFDKMPHGEEEMEAAGGEGIDALPNAILVHILGFLPAEEAVRTCVLARRWRHLWKHATSLHVLVDDGEFLGTAAKLQKFVNHLLPLRKRASLDMCDLSVGSRKWHNKTVRRRVNDCLRHAASRRVRFLRLSICLMDPCWNIEEHELENLPLVSRHLTRLELHGVVLCKGFLDLQGCSALEHLVLDRCALGARSKMISFKSLKLLIMTRCIISTLFRTRILAPNLVSLLFGMNHGMTPMLDSMPSLVDAYVNITLTCVDTCKLQRADDEEDCDCDSCDCSDSTGGDSDDCDCDSCDGFHNIGDGNNNCVLLKGLSEAMSLTLISEPTMVIFRNDLRWCPTFGKLKTLLLNDYWCVPDDFLALACILEHSPVLEKLTLQFFSKGPAHNVEFEGSVTPTLGSVFSKHLKRVEIKCKVVNERILKVLKFLNFRHE